jgi:hypothetical protein
LNHGIVGIARKLLSWARWFLHCTEAEMWRYNGKKDKWETNIYSLRRNATYLRKKRVVLMPRWCLCPTIYGSVFSQSI